MDRKMDEQTLIDKILTWSSEKTSSGKSFDELFKIEGISLGWFFKKLFLPGVVPKRLDVYKTILQEKELNLAQRVRFSLTAKILRKALLFNEKRKFAVAKDTDKKLDLKDNKKEKILFLTFESHILDDGSVFRLQNVIDELKKHSPFQEKIIYTSPLSDRSKKKKLGFASLCQYYDQEIAAKAKSTTTTLSRQWNNLDLSIKKGFMRLERKTLWSSVKPLFDFYFSEEFIFVLAAYFEIAKKILEQEKIAGAILTSPNSLFERCFVAAASLRSIPCIVIQHGLGISRRIDFSCPVHYALFGEQNRNKIIAAGAPPEYVHVTGPVVFDQAYQYKDKVQNDSNTILVVTGPYVEDNNLPKKVYFERMSEIIKKIASIPNHTIIIKLHPREKHLYEYEKILKDNNIQNASFFDNNSPRDLFYEAIARCRSFVGFGSGASIEAMIIDKPIVTINPTDTSDIVSLLEDSTINVYYRDDIKAAIERSFLNEEHYRKNREKFLHKHCGLVDGKASERVVKLASRLIELNKEIKQ